MTLWWLLTICVLAVSVSGLSITDKTEGINGRDGWMVPTKEGGLKWLSIAEANEQLEAYESINDLEIDGRISLNAVNFYLYTKSNPTKGQTITASKSSIDASDFNSENPTRLTIHGWNSNYMDGVNTKVRDAWFLYGDYNMIAVDWSRGRSLEYASSVAAVSSAGAKVAKLIDFLVKEYGMSLETLEIVGFSLGAQVAGHTAKQVTTGKVQKVVGLDPALPLMSYDKTAKRLNSDDAVYVESIQTNGGTLGYTKPIGRAAFYPNGGKSQPGCGLDLTGSCSHTRAVSYYVESLTLNNFPTIRCPSYNEANKKDCGSNYSTVRMGSPHNIITAFGEFYVPINKESPYGLGDSSEIDDNTTTAVPEETTTPVAEVETTTTEVPEDDKTTLSTVESTISTTTEPLPSSTDPTTTSEPTSDDPTTTSEPTSDDPTTTSEPTSDDSTTTSEASSTDPATTPEPTSDDPTTASEPTSDDPTTTTDPTFTDPTITSEPSSTDPTTSTSEDGETNPTPLSTTTVPTTISTPGIVVPNPPEDGNEKGGQTNIYIINLIYVKAQINKNLSEA